MPLLLYTIVPPARGKLSDSLLQGGREVWYLIEEELVVVHRPVPIRLNLQARFPCELWNIWLGVVGWHKGPLPLC